MAKKLLRPSLILTETVDLIKCDNTGNNKRHFKDTIYINEAGDWQSQLSTDWRNFLCSEMRTEVFPLDSPARRKVLSKMKRLELKSTEYRFKRACDQIILLNRKMTAVMQRYHAARANFNRNFRYKLRLRLAIVEGIRNMYYDYANKKASEIVTLRRDLFGEIIEIVTDQDQGEEADEYEDETTDVEYDEASDADDVEGDS